MRAIEIVMKQLADAVAEGMANRAARAVIEGEGQALTRAVSRPRARGAVRQEAEAAPQKPAFEMPLPKPHPSIQDAGADNAGKAGNAGPNS